MENFKYYLEVMINGKVETTFGSNNVELIREKYIDFDCLYPCKAIVIYIDGEKQKLLKGKDKLFNNTNKRAYANKVFFKTRNYHSHI